jgi:hypothetical protein
MLFPGQDNWRAGMQDVSAAIDDTMGELVTMTPASPSKPNFPAVPDPSRAVTVTAAFTNRAKDVIMGDSVGRMSSGHSISPIVSTSEPIFSFASEALPFAPTQGCRITRLCNGEVYEVKDMKPDGVARIVVPVVLLGVSKEGE